MEGFSGSKKWGGHLGTQSVRAIGAVVTPWSGEGRRARPAGSRSAAQLAGSVKGKPASPAAKTTRAAGTGTRRREPRILKMLPGEGRADGVSAPAPTAADGGGAELRDMQSTLRRHQSQLELVNSTFGDVVESVGSSRASLGELLNRVREMYLRIFDRLADDVGQFEAWHEQERLAAAKKSEEAIVALRARADDLTTRLQVLSQSCASKDAVIAVHKKNEAGLEEELRQLRQLLITEAATTREKARMLMQTNDPEKDLALLLASTAHSSESPTSSGNN